MATSDSAAAAAAAETAAKAEAGVDDEGRADSSEECNKTPVENLPAKAAAPPPSPKDFIISVARKITEQAPQSFGPGVWGVLTAISSTARKRPQGMNIILDRDEHCFGRLVDDPRFHIDGFAVSARHCKIYRTEDADTPSGFSIFLKDHSTNGTFLNWEKVTKHVPEVRMQHGDIVSFVAPPHREVAVAFVYREVLKTASLENKTAPKRKLDNFGPENKRPKGLGIGAPEGPVSLDDVRSLQRSNTELRKQLESHVHEIETMRNKNLAAVARHDQELKMLKETVTSSFLDQTKELQHNLEIKQKEYDELSAVAIKRQQAVEDLNKRLTVSVQSRMDADEIINSQKSTITELEAQLTEERCQRRKEREKALEDLKSALEKMKSELQEELKKQSDVALKQQKELQEVISKLQEADKEGRVLAETLRSKLENTRESLVMSEKRVRQLEAQLHEEQLGAANARKKAETMEMQAKKLRKEIECEKVAREEAWAKVSALELEISAAIRDLTIEKQRFQGARERIILRETQLRAFYSTTEEIAALFAKQQEQLKAMQKALEDEENCETASVDIDLDTIKENLNGALGRERTDSQRRGNTVRGISAVSNLNNLQGSSGTYSDDDGSATVKHDYDHKSQEDGDTQEMECTSADPSVRGFISDMDRAGKAPVMTIDLNCKSQEVGNTEEKECIKTDCSVRTSGFERDGICGGPVINGDLNCPSQEDGDTEVMDNADCSVKGFGSDIGVVGRDPIQNLELNDTERVLVSESQAHDKSHCKRDFSLRKCSNKNLGGDNMRRDDEAQDQETEEHQRDEQGANQGEGLRNLEDTEACSIKTADLLASEVAGSWAINTASDHVGENESPGSDDEHEGSHEQAGTLLCRSDVQAAGSQTHPPVVGAAPNLSEERRALNQMIGIVAPDMKDQFPVETENELESGSDSETEVGSGSSSGDDKMNIDDDEDNEDDDATQQLQ